MNTDDSLPFPISNYLLKTSRSLYNTLTVAKHGNITFKTIFVICTVCTVVLDLIYHFTNMNKYKLNNDYRINHFKV